MGVHPRIRERLEAQRGVAASWQWANDGCSPKQIRHAVTEMRSVHQGVWLSGDAPLTDWQRWKAATITADGTRLSDWSGAAFLGLRTSDRWPTTVKRKGQGGPRFYPANPRRLGSLRVSFAGKVEADTIMRDEIPVLHAGRIALDLMESVGEPTGRRMLRDTLRLKLATPQELQLLVAKHHGRRGIVDFRRYVHDYTGLGLDRTRSDAEALALDLLRLAGVDTPAVNVVVAGGEGDLVYFERRLILELDGPQYHQFLLEDAIKQARWERAGWVVRRLPTDEVYDRPHLLLDEAARPVSEAERQLAAATRTHEDVLARLKAARAARGGAHAAVAR